MSFGPFVDLSRPDGLISLGGVALNVMPLVMTALNLVTVAFAATKPSRNEKIQLVVVASIFLVLLYNMPVGLVLYWTMNNAFSLAKNLVSGKLLRGRWSFWGLVETLPLVVLLLALFAVAPYTLWQTSSTLGVKLTVAALLYPLLLRLLRGTRFRREHFYGMRRLVPLAFVVTSFLAYVQSDSTYSHNLVCLSLGLCLAVVYCIMASDREQIRQPPGSTILCSALALSAIFFVFNPLLIYFTSPDRIGTISGLTLVSLLLQALLAAFLLFKGQGLCGRFPRAYAGVLAWAALVAFTYSFVAHFNYGLSAIEQSVDRASRALPGDEGSVRVSWIGEQLCREHGAVGQGHGDDRADVAPAVAARPIRVTVEPEALTHPRSVGSAVVQAEVCELERDVRGKIQEGTPERAGLRRSFCIGVVSPLWTPDRGRRNLGAFRGFEDSVEHPSNG